MAKTRSRNVSRFSATYLAYIKSAHWRYVKRPQVFSHYGYRCMNPKGCPHEDAGSAKNPYQVDHLQYPQRGSSIEAFKSQPVEDFQVLCKRCHAAIGKQRKSRKS